MISAVFVFLAGIAGYFFGKVSFVFRVFDLDDEDFSELVIKLVLLRAKYQTLKDRKKRNGTDKTDK